MINLNPFGCRAQVVGRSLRILPQSPPPFSRGTTPTPFEHHLRNFSPSAHARKASPKPRYLLNVICTDYKINKRVSSTSHIRTTHSLENPPTTITMTDCLVLNDASVTSLLTNQTKSEILTFLSKIETSLRSFSGDVERAHQPEPAVVRRPEGSKNLFRIFTSPTGVGVKIIVHPSQKDIQNPDLSEAERKRLDGLHGTLVLCDQHGFPAGFINAAEITGYRTTLSAMIMYVRRENTGNVVVFGAGKQALWHLRIALGLRGDEIERVTLVNRSAAKAEELLRQVEGENKGKWKSKAVFETVLSGDEERLERVLGEADVIFCTTGSQKPLFAAGWVAGKDKGKGKGKYISAIGSWQSDMIELDPELIKTAVEMDDNEGTVIVDNGVDCVENTGEIVQSGLGIESFTEVGKVLQSLPPAEAGSSSEEISKGIKSGLLVYKSVGVGLTDLAAGQALLDLAREKGKGMVVSDF